MEQLYGVAPGVLALLVLAAALAGWVDAVSGGGGLIQLPALLVGAAGRGAGDGAGHQQALVDHRHVGGGAHLSRGGGHRRRDRGPHGAGGVRRARRSARWSRRTCPGTFFRPLALVLLVVVGLWTLLRPALGEQQDLRWHGGESHARHGVAAVAMGAGIGLYDGVFGPGTGTFLVFGLVALLGYSFLNASAIAKIVNVATNLAALIVFSLGGHVLWALGLTMGVANLVGAVIGARTAVRRGSGFVRVVFLVVVGVLLVKLGYDVLTG